MGNPTPGSRRRAGRRGARDRRGRRWPTRRAGRSQASHLAAQTPPRSRWASPRADHRGAEGDAAVRAASPDRGRRRSRPEWLAAVWTRAVPGPHRPPEARDREHRPELRSRRQGAAREAAGGEQLEREHGRREVRPAVEELPSQMRPSGLEGMGQGAITKRGVHRAKCSSGRRSGHFVVLHLQRRPVVGGGASWLPCILQGVAMVAFTCRRVPPGGRGSDPLSP
jgi:hypothetical protein